MTAATLLLYLLDTLKAAHRALKLEDWVNDKSATELTGAGWRFKTLHDFQLVLTHVNKICGIKKPRGFADLLQISISKCLFNYNVDQALVNWIFIIAKISRKWDSRQGRCLNENRVLDSLQTDFNFEVFLKLRKHVDSFSRTEVETEATIKGWTLVFDNLVN